MELALDERGRGVDALRAHGLRMLATTPDAWPDLLLLVGDQVYADLKANILPGVTLVPGMVVAIEKAQERGIAYHRQ